LSFPGSGSSFAAVGQAASITVTITTPATIVTPATTATTCTLATFATLATTLATIATQTITPATTPATPPSTIASPSATRIATIATPAATRGRKSHHKSILAQCFVNPAFWSQSGNRLAVCSSYHHSTEIIDASMFPQVGQLCVDPSQLVIPRQQFHFCCCMQQSKNSCWCMQENIEATYTTIVTLVEPSQPITHVSSVLTCHSHQQCHTTLENSLNTSSVTNETVTLLVLDVKKIF
jgi:hypothetical protein